MDDGEPVQPLGTRKEWTAPQRKEWDTKRMHFWLEMARGQASTVGDTKRVTNALWWAKKHGTRAGVEEDKLTFLVDEIEKLLQPEKDLEYRRLQLHRWIQSIAVYHSWEYGGRHFVSNVGFRLEEARELAQSLDIYDDQEFQLLEKDVRSRVITVLQHLASAQPMRTIYQHMKLNPKKKSILKNNNLNSSSAEAMVDAAKWTV